MKKNLLLILLFFLPSFISATVVVIDLVEFRKELQALDALITIPHCLNEKTLNKKAIGTSLNKLMSLNIPTSSDPTIQQHSRDIYMFRNRLVNFLNSYINKNVERDNHCDRYFHFLSDLMNSLNSYIEAERSYTFRLKTEKLLEVQLKIIDSLRREVDTIRLIALTSDSTQHVKLDSLLNRNCQNKKADLEERKDSIKLLIAAKFSFLIQNDENLKELDFGILQSFKSSESLWWGVDGALAFGQSKKQLGLRFNLGVELDDVFSTYSLLLHGGPAFYLGSDEANSGFQVNLSLLPDNGSIGFGLGFSTYQNILGVNLLIFLD